ncbi:MAG: hypothetical protein IKV86_01845, partial [Clostridia bacterium]|nr:hypothetical protein [Clostridia bacterium]
MKKLLATILAAMLVLTSFGTVFAAQSGSNPANTLDITAFDTVEGLKGTVTLAADVTSAKLLIDGDEVSTIAADGSASYNINVAAADAVKKIGKSLVEIQCYNAGGLCDTVSTSASAKFYNPAEVVVNYNAAQLKAGSVYTTGTRPTGCDTYPRYNETEDALQIYMGTTTASNWYISLSSATAGSKVYATIKDYSNYEVSFKYKTNTPYAGLKLENWMYTETGKGQYVDGNARPNMPNLNLDASDPSTYNKWYEIKACYNIDTQYVTVYRKDLSVQGAEYVQLYTKKFSSNSTGNLHGFHYLNIYISNPTNTEDNTVYFKDFKITKEREVEGGIISGIIAADDSTVEAVNGQTDISAKAVLASIEAFPTLTADKVSLYRNGALCDAATYDATVDAENKTLKIAPKESFISGDYKIVIDGTVPCYNSGALGIPYEFTFNVKGVNSFAVTSLNTTSGLLATATFEDDVTSAKLLIDGTEVKTIMADGSNKYTISIPAADAAKKIGTSTLTLNFYKNAEFCDSISVEEEVEAVKYDVVSSFVPKEIGSTQLYIGNRPTGTPTYMTYNETYDASEFYLGTTTTTTAFFDLTTNDNRYKHYLPYIKESGIFEVSFKYMQTTPYIGIAFEVSMHAPDRSDGYDYAIVNGTARPVMYNLNENATTNPVSNKWYEFKIIYNSFTQGMAFYKKDLSVQNSDFVEVYSAQFGPSSSHGNLVGFKNLRVNVKNPTVVEGNAIYVKDFKITQERVVPKGIISSAVLSDDTTASVENSLVANGAKAVVAPIA